MQTYNLLHTYIREMMAQGYVVLHRILRSTVTEKVFMKKLITAV